MSVAKYQAKNQKEIDFHRTLSLDTWIDSATMRHHHARRQTWCLVLKPTTYASFEQNSNEIITLRERRKKGEKKSSHLFLKKVHFVFFSRKNSSLCWPFDFSNSCTQIVNWRAPQPQSTFAHGVQAYGRFPRTGRNVMSSRPSQAWNIVKATIFHRKVYAIFPLRWVNMKKSRLFMNG